MWLYENKEFTSEEIGDYIGFVYMVTDLSNGKKYIGKKLFVSTNRLPPLKGKTRKRVVKKESDWKKYYGSSEEIKLLVEAGNSFKREILHLCKTRGEMSYMEAKLQFQYDVLLRDDFYNEFIGCKIHAKSVKGLKNTG